VVGHGYRRFAFLGDPDTAASEAGLRIPEDLAVTGWVDVMPAAFAGLTTVRQPMRQLGATAARWLHDRITERTSDPTRRPAPVRREVLLYSVGQNRINFGLLLAGAVVAVLPALIVFVLLQRHLLQGIATTGLK
jgi:Periplasmic binding protein-like domain